MLSLLQSDGATKVYKNMMTINEDWAKESFSENGVLRPRMLAVDASTACQLDCVDCYMRKKDYDGVGKGMLSADKLIKMVENYPYVQAIELSNNGEALLNPDLTRILEYLYMREIAAYFYNGVNINTASDDLLEAIVKYKVRGMTVSIDGATQEIYEKYRRNGNINTVIENIEKINFFKKKYQSTYPLLIWQYILMNHNECDITKAKEMAKSIGMDIVFKLAWGNNAPQDSEFIRRETGLNIIYRDESYPWEDRCRELIICPHINWDGELLGCCSAHHQGFGINVFEEGVENGLNSDKYLRCVEDVLSKKKDIDESTPCGNCQIYYEHILEDG